jgi:transglutaminase-like putative cysteine protease
MLAIAHRFKFGTHIGAESQRLYWTMGALAIALLPHILQLPPWILIAVATAALWRIAIEKHAWRLPPRWLRIAIAFTAMGAVAFAFRTLNGLDAGTALLATMAGIKLLETRGTRDCTMIIFIGYVLLFAALLYDQSLMRLPYILVISWLLTATLLRLHQSTRPVRARAALLTTGTVLLQALPVAALMFLFFPRLPGQLWALPSRSSATSGLGDEMSPGDISDLVVSGDPAFRVQFEGTVPAPAERYWRGPVLHEFDGRRWRRDRRQELISQEVAADGPVYEYRITIEPTQREWVFALDMPTRWPEDLALMYDLQLVARRPISTLSSFTLQSHTQFHTPPTLSRTMRALDTALPGTANPRTRALATSLRETAGSDSAYIKALLEKFRREEFYYTLVPPLLGDNSIDDFLFETRQGFCEHFASAFTTLMRAANIPARVVTGYQGGEYNSLGNYLLIKQSDAHAWSEVWLEGQGWTRVDPTAAVAPERIQSSIDAALSENETVPGRFLRNNPFFARARLTWDAVNNYWNDRVVQYNEAKQLSLMAWLGIKNADYRSLVIVFSLALLAFFVGLAFFLGRQYRPRKRDAILLIYEELCRKLARINLAKQPYEGPVNYLQRAATEQPQLASELRELRNLYTSLRYGPAPLPSELSRLKYLVNQLQPRARSTRVMET